MARSRLEQRREEIRSLYRSGLSSTRIAEIIGGCTYGAIGWIVRDIARDRNTAISLSKPPKSMKKGACHARARGIMRRHLGRALLPSEHHRDYDYTNNHLDNLELLTVSEHNRVHENWRYRWRG